MNGWYVVSWLLFVVAALVVLLGGEAKWVEALVLAGAGFFALGHGSTLRIGGPGSGPAQ